jgi:uncharacterized protein (TIGR03435 family)
MRPHQICNHAIRRRINVVFLGFTLWGVSLGQTPSPTFEVASVRRVDSKAPGQHSLTMRGGPGTPDPDQIAYGNISLMAVLRNAFDAYPFQIEGPASLSSEQYDISAKVPLGTTRDQFRLMLINLIVERFHLVLHHESREVAGYELVVGKNGSKLKVSTQAIVSTAQTPPVGAAVSQKTDSNGFPVLDGPGVAMRMGIPPGAKRPSIYLAARAQTMSGLVHTIGEELGRPVSDHTGLTREYDYTIEFAPDTGGLGPPSAGQAPETLDESGPNIGTALEQQLGLKLRPQKVPIDIVIIDSVDKEPTAN